MHCIYYITHATLYIHKINQNTNSTNNHIINTIYILYNNNYNNNNKI